MAARYGQLSLELLEKSKSREWVARVQTGAYLEYYEAQYGERGVSGEG